MARPKTSMRRYDVLAALQQDERASLRELCETCGIRSTSQVYVLLNQLEEEGMILRKGGARCIFLTPQGKRFQWEPVAPVRKRSHMQERYWKRGEVTLPRLSAAEEERRIEMVVAKAHRAGCGACG